MLSWRALGAFEAAWLAVALALPADAHTHRSAAVRAEFKRLHPCPSTGRPAGACPGYIIDHVKPLCAGGADSVTNMQWQTVAAAKLKDRDERRDCSVPKH